MARADAETTGTEAEQVSCRFSMRTDMGLRRTENQDTYGYVRSRLSSLFIVADGMGGARGGATASAIAVDVVCREVSRKPLTEPTLKQAIEKANRAIFEKSREDENLQGMGTTFVALALVGSHGFLAHVGDSRAYLLRDGVLTKLTRDHTLIQELLETGAISDDQAENHPIAHMLTRSLGPARAVEVEFSPIPGPLKRGDRFLLCCDGLYNMLSDEEVARILLTESLDNASQKLVDKANDAGGTDNITVEVIDVCPINEGQSDLGLDELEFFTSSELDLGELNLSDDLSSDEAADGSAESAIEPAAEPQINGHNGGGHGDVASEKSSSQKSSIDSIIFGNMPTDDDIREHHESVKKSVEPAEAALAQSNAESSAAVPEEDVDRIVETKELKLDIETVEHSERETLQLRRIQYGAIAAVAIAVCAAAYVLIPAKTPPPVDPIAATTIATTGATTSASTSFSEATESSLVNPPAAVPAVEQAPEVVKAVDVAPELATPAIEIAAIDSPFALPEQAPRLPEPEPEIVKPDTKAVVPEPVITEPVITEPVKSEPQKSETQKSETAKVEPVVTAPVVSPPIEHETPKTEAPEPIAVEPTVVKAPVIEPPPETKPLETKPLGTKAVEAKLTEPATKAPETTPEAWPEAKVTTSAAEAQLQALAVPATAQKDDPNLIAYLPKDADPAIAQAMAEAADLSVPPAPAVKDPTLSDQPDQPIVWEHEQVALQKVITAPTPEIKSSTSETSTGEALETTDDEKKSVFQKKNELRDKVSALDARMRAFSLRSVTEAKKRLAQLDSELDVIDKALEQTNKNIELAKRRYQIWVNRKDFLVTGAEPFKLAEEVAANSEQAKRKKEAHDVTSVRYLDAVERWRETPSDNTATQNMTTLGRELRERRAELEEAVVKAVDTSLEQVVFDLAEFGSVKSDLERRRDRLNRQVGFIKAYNVNANENRLDKQRKLLAERNQVAAELESLRSRMSDQAELDYRRSLIVSQYSLPK